VITIIGHLKYYVLDLFKHSTKKKTRLNDKTPSTYDEELTTGSSIGKIITSIWNSQKNPGKAYVLNRRIHHGENRNLLELSNLFKKIQGLPLPGSYLELEKPYQTTTSRIKVNGSSLRKRRIKPT
jgi:hypothetical protein